MEKWLKFGLLVWVISLIPVNVLMFFVAMSCGFSSLGSSEPWYCFFNNGIDLIPYFTISNVVFFGIVIITSFLVNRIKTKM